MMRSKVGIGIKRKILILECLIYIFERFGDYVSRGDEVDDLEGEGNGLVRVMNELESYVEVEKSKEKSEIEDEVDDEEDGFRRLDRVRRKLDYFSEYICFVEIECERILIMINEEFWDFEEVKVYREWVVECEDEIEFIVKNKMWDLVELLFGVKVIGLKLVFKIKRNFDGSIIKFKVRLVVKGYV